MKKEIEKAMDLFDIARESMIDAIGSCVPAYGGKVELNVVTCYSDGYESHTLRVNGLMRQNGIVKALVSDGADEWGEDIRELSANELYDIMAHLSE